MLVLLSQGREKLIFKMDIIRKQYKKSVGLKNEPDVASEDVGPWLDLFI